LLKNRDSGAIRASAETARLGTSHSREQASNILPTDGRQMSGPTLTILALLFHTSNAMTQRRLGIPTTVSECVAGRLKSHYGSL